MQEENSNPPQQEKPKRKLNVKHGELNMPETLNKEQLKSPSSDKLRKSLLPSSKVPHHTSKIESIDLKTTTNQNFYSEFFIIFFSLLSLLSFIILR